MVRKTKEMQEMMLSAYKMASNYERIIKEMESDKWPAYLLVLKDGVLTRRTVTKHEMEEMVERAEANMQ